ncbi:hypothetical protein ABTY98_41545 [Streptomyces sp. NPDC096040]|uniref:hypothetical protein n=1 Tax=Streptomyces sp. NPDC096040 TaxID=3155541 RepID=UPI0033312729
MADPTFISGAASPASAAYIVDLIQEAAALAVTHFDQQPPGEEADVYVNLTASTGYGVLTLGTWLFHRDAAGAVTLAGAEPEAARG